MNARAPRTAHARRVHFWINTGNPTRLSLCDGIEADEDYLQPTTDPVDCKRCAAKLHHIAVQERQEEVAEDHEAALARERTYEFHRPRTAEQEELYRQARPELPKEEK